MSPLKSRAQLGKIASLEKEGKLPKGSLKEWISATPNIHDLPKRVGKKRKRNTVKVIK